MAPMASSLRVRPRSSLVLRIAAGGALLAAVRHFGPAFTVKGAWEGTIEDLKTLPKGLEPTSSGGWTVSHGGVKVANDNDVVGLTYADGPLSFKMDDFKDWAANFTQDGLALKLKGGGAGGVDWEASKSSSVAGLGDVDLELNSDGGVEVGLTPSLPAVKGLGLQAHTLSNSDGIAGRLAASTSSNGVNLNYVVENDAGNYDLASLKHLVQLAAKVADGDASAAYTYDDDGQNYNASFSTRVAGGDASLAYADGSGGQSYNVSFSRALTSGSDAVLGVDEDGLYGALSVSRDLGDLGATFDVSGRAGTDGNNATYGEALTLSHELGSVTVSSGDDGEVDVTGKFDVDSAGTKLHADVGYSLSAKEPTYNVTASRDLSDLLKASSDLKLGVDGEGVYGSLSVSRDIGNGLSLDYSSAGRPDSLESRIKLQNALGYAELLKAGAEDPRVRLGYEFDV